MNEITIFQEFETDIVAFEGHNAELMFNIETTRGSKDCRSHLAKLRKVWNGIERMRKTAKAGYIAQGKAVDLEAKSFQGRIDIMHKLHNDPLKAQEARWEAAILAKEEAAKAKAEKEEAERIAAIEAREEEANARLAEIEKREAVAKAARDLFEAEKQAEADKVTAVEDAKLQAAQDAIDAAKKAEQDKLDAVAEVKRQIADEISQDAENKLQEQIAADIAEEKRQANVEHRKEFNNLALDAINSKIDDPATSLRLVKAIVKGEIPNVTLNY